MLFCSLDMNANMSPFQLFPNCMSWAHRPPALMDMYPPQQSNNFQYLRQLLENEILNYCALPRAEAENRSVNKDKESRGDFLPNFPYDNIGKHLVRKYGLTLAIDQLTDILHFMHEYNAIRPSGHLYTQGGLTKSTSISPIVFQILFKVIVVPDPTDRRPEGKTKKNTKRPPRQMLNNLTDTQTLKIFNAVVAIDVNVEAKLLSKAVFMLQLRENMDKYGPCAVRAVTEGWASFASTIFFMHNPAFSKYFDSPEVIRTALCLGPLRATTVESFAMNRPTEFREACRQMLHNAELAATCHSFLAFCPQHLVHRYGAIRFEANIRSLMDEMRGDLKHDQLINPGWAFAAIKKYSKKTFQDKEWAYENLHELFWTILYQRPNLRKNIIAACKPENEQYAAYWQRISTANVSIADVPRDIPMVTGDPLDASIVPGGPFLTFSNEMRELIFVNTAQLVSEMSAEIERRAEGVDGLMVALDAEWSAYESYAAASILQISLDDVSYIVDVDVLPRDIVRPFIEMLFAHPKILKLGFQFHEDLAQLRMAKSLRGCAALYRPKNLSCILKLIVHLTEESEKRANAAEILEEFGVSIGSNGKEKEEGGDGETEAEEEKDEKEEKEEKEEEKSGDDGLLDTSTESVPALEKPAAVTRVRPSTVVTRVSTRSLSSLCESLLGLPLDKREQCSVWTRRPLRALQLRYAAMDAFCLLLLHARCKKWAEKLGLPMEEMMSRHFESNCSLPLFIGD